MPYAKKPKPKDWGTMFPCSHCHRSYMRKDHLRRHVQRTHPHTLEEIEKKFHCSECRTMCFTQSELNRHMKRVHRKKYGCKLPDQVLEVGIPHCRCTFSVRSQLWYHICTAHASLPKKFVWQMFAQSHAEEAEGVTDGAQPSPRDEKGGETPPTADDEPIELLGPMFPVADTINFDASEPAEPTTGTGKTAICPYLDCGSEFTNRAAWLKHLQNHALPRQVCVICRERFPTQTALKLHQARENHKPQPTPRKMTPAHTPCQSQKVTPCQSPIPESNVDPEDVVYKCWRCDLVYTSTKGLHQHVRRVHESAEPDDDYDRCYLGFAPKSSRDVKRDICPVRRAKVARVPDDEVVVSLDFNPPPIRVPIEIPSIPHV